MDKVKEECPACNGNPTGTSLGFYRDAKFKRARANLKGGKVAFVCVLCRGKGKVSRRRAVTYVLRQHAS